MQLVVVGRSSMCSMFDNVSSSLLRAVLDFLMISGRASSSGTFEYVIVSVEIYFISFYGLKIK